MRVGIHTSIGQGLEKAVLRLVKLGCNACQMFSRSPRGGRARALNGEDVAVFRRLCQHYDIDPVAVHIPYVLNLATADPEMHEYAVSMVREDLERANLLGAAYLVLHMGSHRGAGAAKGLAQVAGALNKALDGYDGRTVLLLENTSGAGSEVGSTFEQIKEVLDRLDPDRTGVCFDTCHAFAAGYDLADAKGVESTLAKLDKVIGLARLKLVHANDSMFPLGSTRDRHADIGRGHIGEEGFRAILRHPRLREVPFILETPADSDADWARNLAELRRLAGGPINVMS